MSIAFHIGSPSVKLLSFKAPKSLSESRWNGNTISKSQNSRPNWAGTFQSRGICLLTSKALNSPSLLWSDFSHIETLILLFISLHMHFTRGLWQWINKTLCIKKKNGLNLPQSIVSQISYPLPLTRPYHSPEPGHQDAWLIMDNWDPLSKWSSDDSGAFRWCKSGGLLVQARMR